MGRPRTGTGYVNYQHDREHQRVVRASGISLLPSDVVHHIDGNKRNNNIDNLQVIPRGEHMRLHLGIEQDEPRAFERVPEECPLCHRIHMVQYRCTKQTNYTGLCKSCNGRIGGVHSGE